MTRPKDIEEQEIGWRVFEHVAEMGPEQQLAWLLEFLQLSSDNLWERWPDLRIEAGAFAFGQPQTRPIDISRDDLIGLVRQVSEGVRTLASGREWRLEIPAITKVYLPRVAKGRRGKLQFSGWDSQRAVSDFRTAFLAWVDDLISDRVAGARLRACARPGCGRLFVKKKRGIYCSQRCSQAERNKRYYRSLAKKDRQASRHDRYVAEVKRISPAAAKLVRRRTKENVE